MKKIMKKIIILLLPLFLTGCFAPAAQVDNTLPVDPLADERFVDEDVIIEDEENKVAEINYSYYGELIDVSGGQAAGVAQAGLTDGLYSLLAELDQLLEPTGTDFYEGWIVRKEPFDFISTGKLIKRGENEFNVFSSDVDLTSYDFYVLTIEPDDGDPAPAEHVLEGIMYLQ
jgi:hypothetical protein